jgi:hypothetical protein
MNSNIKTKKGAVKMKKLSITTLVVILLGIINYSQVQASQVETVLPGQIAQSTKELIQAAGDQALVTLIARPQHWSQARATITKELGDLFKDLKNQDNFLALTFSIVCAYFKKPAPIQDFWQGWDQSRPIVVSALESKYDYATLALRHLNKSKKDDLPFALRSRVIIPATNPSALFKSTHKAIIHLGMNKIKSSKTSSFLLFGFDDASGGVAIFKESSWIRLEIFHHENNGRILATLSKSNKRQVRKEKKRIFRLWQKELRRLPKAKKINNTPAVHFSASQTNDIISMVFRPWKIRDIAANLDISKIFKNTLFAIDKERAVLRTFGIHEVLVGQTLMYPSAVENETIGLSIFAKDSMKITEINEQTELGLKVIKAGLGLAPDATITEPTRIPKSGNINKMLEQAVVPYGLKDIKNISDYGEQIGECGLGCIVHFALTNPMGSAKIVTAMVKSNNISKPAGLLALAIRLSRIQLENAKFQSTLAGYTLVHQTNLNKSSTFEPVPDYSKFNFQPSAPKPEKEIGSWCLFDTIRTSKDLLYAVSYNPQERKAILKDMIAKEDDFVSCTRQDKTLHRQAKNVFRILKSIQKTL